MITSKPYLSLVEASVQADPQAKKAPSVNCPVYIISPTQRCGTNFLADIILLDPAFQSPIVLGEDFLLEHAHSLHNYIEQTYSRWRRLRWIEDPEACKQRLQAHIAHGLSSFLAEEVGENKRLLLKTPTADNVDKFFLFFPSAKLILLVRDGRDVVESAVRTWPKTSYEYWMRRWAKGIRQILDLAQGPWRESEGETWRLVKYEDIIERPEVTVKSLLEFLGIDTQAFDWARLETLPLRGSSSHPDEHAQVQWNPIEKPKDFRPVGRWKHWGFFLKRKFKRIAGRELIELGYVSDNRW